MPKLILVTLLFYFLLPACKKEVVVTEQGPAGEKGAPGAIIPGTIKGVIHYANQYNELNQTGKDSTIVTIMGTGLSTVSNIHGEYEIKDVPPGTYNISIKKSRCGEKQRQQIAFPGNGTFYLNDTIRERATFEFLHCFVKDTIYDPNSSKSKVGKKVTILVQPDLRRRAVIVQISYDSLLDIAAQKHGETIVKMDIPPSKSTVIAVTGHMTGYVRIYPNASGANGAGYLDIKSGNIVYPNVGPSFPVLKLHY